MSREYFRRIERKYGLTFDSLLELLVAQESKCAACGRELVLLSSDRNEQPQVDHAHPEHGGDGRVRGLLCLPCNTALGKLEKDLYRTYSLMVYAGHIDNFLAGAGAVMPEPTRELPPAVLGPALVAKRQLPTPKGDALAEKLSKLWWYRNRS